MFVGDVIDLSALLHLWHPHLTVRCYSICRKVIQFHSPLTVALPENADDIIWYDAQPGTYIFN